MEPAAIEVVCGSTHGTLNLTKFCAGGPRGGRSPACILTGDRWLTPTAFEKHAGKAQCKSWKRTIKVNGVPMYTLMEQGYFMQHSAGCRCVICSAGEQGEEPQYNTSIKPFPLTGIPLTYNGKAVSSGKRQEFLPTMCKAAGSNHFKSELVRKSELPLCMKSEPSNGNSGVKNYYPASSIEHGEVYYGSPLERSKSGSTPGEALTPSTPLEDIPVLPNDSLEDYIEGLEDSVEKIGEDNGQCVKRRMSFDSNDKASSSKRSRLRTPSFELYSGLSPGSNHNGVLPGLSPVRNSSNHILSSLSEQHNNLSTLSQSLPNSDDFFKKYAEVMKMSSKVLEQTNSVHERIDLMSVTVSNLHDDLLNITQTIEMSHLTRLLEDNSDRGLQPADLRALINLLTKFTLKFKTESPIKTPSKSVHDDVPDLVTLDGYRLCNNCNRNSKYVCGQCSNSFYCSKFCQNRGWFTHSSECGIG